MNKTKGFKLEGKSKNNIAAAETLTDKEQEEFIGEVVKLVKKSCDIVIDFFANKVLNEKKDKKDD